MRRARIKRAVCIALVLLPLCLCSCAQPELYDQTYIDLFNTVTRIAAVDADESAANEAIADACALLNEYHRLSDIYAGYDGVNNAYTLNQSAALAPVKVDARLIALLQYGKSMYELTDGRVNIAMGAVLSLWHDSRTSGLNDPENAALPDIDALTEAAEHTDINDLVIDEAAGTVYFADPLLRLDLGALAKGYAVQQACELLKTRGLYGALIAAGGNVCTLGKRADGGSWHIAVQDPFGAGTLCTLLVSGKSVVTSGVYERYYEVDGVRYHHIIDPATLMPSEYYASVTVICDDSALADALSTALFNMEPEVALEFVNAQPGVEALFVLPDGSEAVSDGFGEYVT